MLLRNIYSMEGPVYTLEEHNFVTYMKAVVEHLEKNKQDTNSEEGVEACLKSYTTQNPVPQLPYTDKKMVYMKKLNTFLKDNELDSTFGCDAHDPWFPFIRVAAWTKNVGHEIATGSVFMCVRTSYAKIDDPWYELQAGYLTHNPNFLSPL